MRLIPITLAGVSIILASASGVTAGTQSLIGANYESYASASCNAIDSCRIHFPATPLGKILRIDEVTCSYISPLAPSRTFFGPIADANGYAFIKKTTLELIQSSASGNQKMLSFRSTFKMLIGAGRYPTVYFEVPGASPSTLSADCSLSATVVEG